MNPSPALLAAIEAGLLARKGKKLNLQGVQQIEFCCFTHADEHPSAHWHPTKWTWICRAEKKGGGWRDAATRLGLDIDRLMANPAPSRQNRRPESAGTVVRTYVYKAKGIEFHKERVEFPELTDEGKPRKEFRWSPMPSKHSLTIADMPLFWLEDAGARPDEPVVLVEGEKVVEALWQRQILACCLAGSGGQRDFGNALQELRGRDVWLAADNDETGHTFMQAIAEGLKGIARGVHWVRVPLGPKEDLADFFAHGGKTEALWEGDLSDTSVAVKAIDHLLIRVPTSSGIMAFDVDEIAFTARAIDCEVAVSLEGPGYSHKPYCTRSNLLSSTAISSLRVDLGRFLGTPKELNWTAVLNDVVSAVRATQQSVDHSVDVFDIPETSEAESFLLPGLLPRNQPSMFFGDGESLKSWNALLACVCVVLGQPFPGTAGKVDYGRCMYLDFENIGPTNFRKRLGRLLASEGIPIPPDAIRYWPGRGIPLHNQIGALARYVREHNIRLVVVDGIIGAISGKPEDSDVASLYFQDMAKLGTTNLSIAHVTKGRDGQPTTKPYGSPFWHNLARMTWYFQRSGDGDDSELGLYCRKVTEGPRPAPIALGVHFTGRSGPVEVISKSFLEVDRTLDRLRQPHERLTDAIKTGGVQFESEIAKTLGTKEENVRVWLKKYPNLFQQTNMGWGMATASGWD